MAANIKLEIVTPERTVVSEDAQIVMAPGSEGEFGVLTGHTPFLCTLKAGLLKFKDAQGVERLVFISNGYAEALADRITILADAAERRRDIDIERAQNALARAQQRLEAKAAEEAVDSARAQAALARAIWRVRAVKGVELH